MTAEASLSLGLGPVPEVTSFDQVLESMANKHH